MNSFPESGFPVLADVSDRVCLNTLYVSPLKPSGYILDVLGASRLYGAVAINGALSGVTTLGMAGALSGVTTITMTGTLISSGDISSILARAKKAWLTDLDCKNTPTVQGEPVALIQDLTRYARVNVTTVTDTYQILSSDVTVICNKASGFTVTLPLGVVGTILNIKNINTGIVTISLSGDTIDGASSQTLDQWKFMSLLCAAANTWYIIGKG